MKTKKKIGAGTIVVYVLLCIWAVTTIFPFLWVVVNSFKPTSEVLASSFSLPVDFTLQNYQTAFERTKILSAYKQSMLISGSVTIGVMVLSSLMAFGVTRYKFKLSGFVQGLLVASLMFPAFATIIPVYKMMVEWKLSNTNLSVILPQVANNLSFATIVLIGFLKGIPVEMEEAAYMEGANVFQVFTKIIIPLCKASLSTVAIFSFLWSYNDLFIQQIMIDKTSKFPISNLLSTISSQYGTDFGLMAASVTLIVIPVLIVYMFLQKNIIKGLTAGAIKG